MTKKNLLLLIFLFSVPAVLNADNYIKVKWIFDGDTIKISKNRTVRYLGINTPEIAHRDEPAEPYGYKSKKYNKDLVYKKKVRLEFDREKKDHYGRLLAYVFLKNGVMINEKIIRNGYGFCLYKYPNIKYSKLFLKCQQKAMIEKKGIWKNFNKKKIRLTGNKKSRRFHVTACSFGKHTKRKNKIKFFNLWDAFYKGYAPCKKCNPHK